MSRFTFAFGLGLVTIGGLAGCSGGSSSDRFGPDPDFDTLDAQLATPTGSLSTAGVARSVDAIDALSAPEIAIGTLAHATPSESECAALAHGDPTGTCACPVAARSHTISPRWRPRADVRAPILSRYGCSSSVASWGR
jgi:hypothetical protein